MRHVICRCLLSTSDVGVICRPKKRVHGWWKICVWGQCLSSDEREMTKVHPKGKRINDLKSRLSQQPSWAASSSEQLCSEAFLSSAPQQLFSDVILSNHLRLPSPQQPYFTRNLQQPSSAAFLGLPSIGGQLFHIISRSSYMATFLWKNPFAALSGKGRPWKNSTVAFWSLTILPRIKHFDSLKFIRVSSPSLDTSACQP